MIQTRNVRTTPLRSMFNQAIQDERAWSEDQKKMEANYPRFGIEASGEGGRLGGILGWIERRVYDRNQSATAIITGAPGSGKSWSCMHMLEKLDKNFDIGNIAFYPKEFTRALKEEKRSFLIDDVGMQLSARDSMTRVNKQYSKLFQGLRFKNKITFMSLPSFGMLDKDLRNLSQIYAQAISINRRTNRVKMIIRFLSIDPKQNRIYFYSPIVKSIVEQGAKRYAVYEKVSSVDIPTPSKSLIAQYEYKKDASFAKFVDSIVDDEEGKTNGDTPAKNGQPKYLIVGRMIERGLTVDDISKILNSSKNSVNRLAHYYRKKET